MKINEIENRKRMGGNLGLDTMNEVSSLIATGLLTPVISTDKEGTISIRFEPRNRENVVNTLSTNQNNLSGPLLQGMLAILKKQAEFADNMVKCMETKQILFLKVGVKIEYSLPLCVARTYECLLQPTGALFNLS